jgi:hypothetical protein
LASEWRSTPVTRIGTCQIAENRQIIAQTPVAAPVENRRFLYRSNARNGSAVARSTTTSATMSAAAAPKLSRACGRAQPSWPANWNPTSSASEASVRSTAPARSTFPFPVAGRSCHVAWTMIAVTIPTGMFRKKMDCQPNIWVIQLPSSGPISAAMPHTLETAPCILARSSRS